MPLYEYKCEDCGAAFEKLTRPGDKCEPRCPACGSERGRRLVSRVAAVAKSATAESCDAKAG